MEENQENRLENREGRPTEAGFFERIQGAIHPAVVEHYYKDNILSTASSSPYLLDVMRAHACMLADQGIIPREAGAALAETLTGWKQSGGITPDMIDPSLEDLYINMEHLLSKALGEEIAGHLPVARSRNDVEAAMWRIEMREKLRVLARSAINHCAVLDKRAREHLAAPMPGYTYHQQAMPVTLGFQLSCVSSAMLRDIARIIDCIERLDVNPLGSAALSGSGYDVDRQATAQFLGFADVMDNCEDSVSACDYMLEAASCSLQLLVTLGRFAEEVIKWCQNETGFADLSDSMIDSSSIMPHKRNPVVPATVRAFSRLKAGDFAGLAAACVVPFEASRDVTVVFTKALDMVNTAWDMCEISKAYTGDIRFHAQKMRDALSIGFSFSAELADTMVRDGGLTFRAAHSIVGGAVSELYDAGKGPEAMSYRILDQWSQKLTGAPLPITEDAFRKACDTDENIARRKHFGGTSSERVSESIDARTEQAGILLVRLMVNELRWKEAEMTLDEACEALIQSV
ncbi:MAG: argininosuccinate lyase [Clostridiales bacterium]|nr:argininosuccinate lyase [Clostridiales bacterium]